MAFEKYQLNGKVAMITGASGLLGKEHAKALLEAGAKVVLTDISEKGLEVVKEQLNEQYNLDSIITEYMDVTNEINIKETEKKLSEQGLRIDILVNNAAIDPKVNRNEGLKESSRFENFSLEQWNLEINVGLTGAFLCSQIFGSKMASDKRGGVILNISSDLSVLAPDQRLYFKENFTKAMQPVKPVSYSVIKTGLIGLTRYLATYWASENIRCNALSPGGVFNDQDIEFVNRLKNLIPMDRMADVDEYKSAIQFLCSDASSYMNGQNIVIDGGRSIW